eukprot:6182245-Pleurochrysis_carterae.AAC.1
MTTRTNDSKVLSSLKKYTRAQTAPCTLSTRQAKARRPAEHVRVRMLNAHAQLCAYAYKKRVLSTELAGSQRHATLAGGILESADGLPESVLLIVTATCRMRSCARVPRPRLSVLIVCEAEQRHAHRWARI